MTDTNNQFGAYIRYHREMKDISLNHFAKMLGKSTAYWSRVERGLEKPCRTDLIVKIIMILELPYDETFLKADKWPFDMELNKFEVIGVYRAFELAKNSM